MLPVKMMEYIALGIPVVAPKLRAIEYYFNDEMVSFFDPESVESLTERIMSLYHDSSRRRNQAEKAKSFLEQFGWESDRFNLLDLYQHLSPRKENYI